MKKLTKKAIKEMPQYIVIIDWMSGANVIIEWMSGAKKPFDYIPVNVNNILDAMDVAESYKSNDVYLIKIAEKTDRVYDTTALIYEDVLVTRSHGWHRSDEKHGECNSWIAYYPEYNYFTHVDKTTVFLSEN